MQRSIDVMASTVLTDSLRSWLAHRGWNEGFFFPRQGSTEPYLDHDHARFAPKLYAAVMAWKTVGEQTNVPGSVKSRITNWLTSRAAP